MTGPHELGALLALARAQLAGRSVRLRFLDGGETPAERTVDVLALSFDPPRWLVATWSPELDSLRLLDLARVLRVRAVRRRARSPPPGFDAIHLSTRAFLQPRAGRPAPRQVTVRLSPPWSRVARALVPAGKPEPAPGGTALLRVPATRPRILRALVESLTPAALDSPSQCPAPRARRRPTRPASSGSPRGSSRSRSP